MLVLELQLTEAERRLTRMLLGATPVAVRGETTLAPLSELCSLYDRVHPGLRRVQLLLDLEAMLSKPRKVEYEVKDCSCVMQFPILQDFSMASRGGNFLTYEFNPYFLERLHAIQRARELPSLY